MHGMWRIPDTVAQLPIRGRNLTGATLAEELGAAPTLLAFLRHLG